MKRKFLATKRCAIALALTLSSSIVAAQGAFRHSPPTFDALDNDKSGSLSEDEVARFLMEISGRVGSVDTAQVLVRWDANKDGSVSRQEFDNRALSRGRNRGARR